MAESLRAVESDWLRRFLLTAEAFGLGTHPGGFGLFLEPLGLPRPRLTGDGCSSAGSVLDGDDKGWDPSVFRKRRSNKEVSALGMRRSAKIDALG